MMTRIIHHTEKLDTLCIRLAYTFDQDARRNEITAAFEAMATDLGKIATRFRPADWTAVQTRVSELRWAAVKADEARVATFAHVGSEAALRTSLHGFAACLGYVLADASTAPIDIEDDAAMAAVEGPSNDPGCSGAAMAAILGIDHEPRTRTGRLPSAMLDAAE